MDEDFVLPNMAENNNVPRLIAHVSRNNPTRDATTPTTPIFGLEGLEEILSKLLQKVDSLSEAYGQISSRLDGIEISAGSTQARRNTRLEILTPATAAHAQPNPTAFRREAETITQDTAINLLDLGEPTTNIDPILAHGTHSTASDTPTTLSLLNAGANINSEPWDLQTRLPDTNPDSGICTYSSAPLSYLYSSPTSAAVTTHSTHFHCPVTTPQVSDAGRFPGSRLPPNAHSTSSCSTTNGPRCLECGSGLRKNSSVRFEDTRCPISSTQIPASATPVISIADTTRPAENAPENRQLNAFATYFVPPTRIRLFPKEYEGKEPWVVYKRHFEAVARANAWSSELKALYLAPYLRGTALAFYDTLDIRVRDSYELLGSAFAERFSDEYRQSTAHCQLRARVQKAKESLSEFATDLQRLVCLAFGDCPEQARNRIALSQFLDGIADVDVQQRVRDVEPGTLEDALAQATRVEASRGAARLSRRHIPVAEANVTEGAPMPPEQESEPSGKGRRLI